jgi:hypothetical protein
LYLIYSDRPTLYIVCLLELDGNCLGLPKGRTSQLLRTSTRTSLNPRRSRNKIRILTKFIGSMVHSRHKASLVVTPNHSANMRLDRSMIVRLSKYSRQGRSTCMITDVDLITLALPLATTSSLEIAELSQMIIQHHD